MSKLKKLMLIVNPVSGRRAAERELARVCQLFFANGYMVSTFVTDGRGDAERWAAEYGAEFDRVACMGGDGTLNEVINGLLGAGLDKEIAFIPTGSTNDFAFSHSLATDIETAVAAAAGDNVQLIDAARFNDRFFTFHSAFGPLANVVNTTPQSDKNMLGYFAYILEGAMNLSTMLPVHAVVEADGQTYEGDYIYGGVVSTLSLGGNLVSIPEEEVKMDDGLYEVFLVKMPQNLIELGETAVLLRSGTLSSPYTEFFSADSVTITSEQNMTWTLDGEPSSDLSGRYEIEVLPKKLKLVCS